MKPKLPTVERKCLMCGKTFQSTSAGNRRCLKCEGVASKMAMSPYDLPSTPGKRISPTIREHE